MKKGIAFILILTLALSFCGAVQAGSILPVLSEPEEEEAAPEEVFMPSLEQVSWYDVKSISKAADGRLRYTYSSVSENAYNKFGVALGEAGYTLKDSSTDEDGHMHFVVENGVDEIELVYYSIGGTMEIYYPENAVPAERDEEALTVRLQLGEPFRTTKECTYSLAEIRAADSYRNIFKSGYPVVFRYDKTRKSDENTQYVIFGFTCENKAKYEVDPSWYTGDLTCDKEGLTIYGDGTGASNAAFTLVNELAKSDKVAGGSTYYYARGVYYHKENAEGPVTLRMTFTSEDNVTKYVYEATIGGEDTSV